MASLFKSLSKKSAQGMTNAGGGGQAAVSPSASPTQGGGVMPKDEKKKQELPLVMFGTFCTVIFLALFFLMPSSKVDTSVAAAEALANKVSTTVSVGTVLLSDDESIGAQDYVITHDYAQEDTTIWIWDYADEDGDYVQVLVNGSPLGDAFMIKNKAVEMSVPAEAEIQVRGVRDGGGGITYAVRYELNGTTYFNMAPEGGENVYTLVRE
jgi:hypothetical protein